MSHIDRLNVGYAYEPFRKVAKLIDQEENVPNTVSVWAFSANACDRDPFRSIYQEDTEHDRLIITNEKVRQYTEAYQNQSRPQTLPPSVAGSKPVWGVAVSLRYFLEVPTGYNCTHGFLPSIYKETVKSMQSEMLDLGINALVPDDGVEPIIFVPNAKVSDRFNNPDDLFTKTDIHSRSLLLAYLVHKGILDFYEDNELIKDVFPMSVRHQVLRNGIDAYLGGLTEVCDIKATPKFDCW